MNFLLSTKSDREKELKDLEKRVKINHRRIWNQSMGNELPKTRTDIYAKEIDYIETSFHVGDRIKILVTSLFLLLSKKVKA